MSDIYLLTAGFNYLPSAMSADRVWAEGLLVFYEVFQFLEGALDRYSHTLVGELDIRGIRRKEAFEKVRQFFIV